MKIGNMDEWSEYLNNLDNAKQLGVELDAVENELKGDLADNVKTNVLLTHIMLDLKIIKHTLRK